MCRIYDRNKNYKENRTGGSISPILFNLIMAKITTSLRRYKLSAKNISFVGYAEDIVLILEKENDLQCLLHTFAIRAKQYNTTAKGKSLQYPLSVQFLRHTNTK